MKLLKRLFTLVKKGTDKYNKIRLDILMALGHTSLGRYMVNKWIKCEDYVRETELCDKIGLSKSKVYIINGVVLTGYLIATLVVMYLGIKGMQSEKMIIKGISKVAFGVISLFDAFMCRVGIL